MLLYFILFLDRSSFLLKPRFYILMVGVDVLIIMCQYHWNLKYHKVGINGIFHWLGRKSIFPLFIFICWHWFRVVYKIFLSYITCFLLVMIFCSYYWTWNITVASLSQSPCYLDKIIAVPETPLPASSYIIYVYFSTNIKTRLPSTKPQK